MTNLINLVDRKIEMIVLIQLMFFLTTIGIMEPLRLELYIFYLDDCTQGGTVETVLHDLQLVEQEAGQLGLHLNHSKLEVNFIRTAILFCSNCSFHLHAHYICFKPL